MASNSPSTIIPPRQAATSPWSPAFAAIKRVFDAAAAAMGLLTLSPLLLVVAVAVKLDSRGPVLFRQKRFGRGMRPFNILKFRTMVIDAPELGKPLTVGEDPRITRLGRWLRRAKIDELPQLINVFKGDMSLVGPRPEVPCYVEMFWEEYEKILAVRPGITDLASIKFRDESTILAAAENPEQEYVSRILPEKIALARVYIQRASILGDGKLILKTLVRLFT